MLFMPLRGPSCKLIFARISAKLRFQFRPSVATMPSLKTTFCISDSWQFVLCDSAFKPLGPKEAGPKQCQDQFRLREGSKWLS